MPGKARTAARPSRRLARLLFNPNKLRRPTDRVEAVVVMLLFAAFLAAVAAAPFFGASIYRSQRAAAAQLRPVEAVLTHSGPSNSSLTSYGAAPARWRAPDGQPRSGVLTTNAAPGIWGAPAGSRVQIWVTGSGELAAQPPGDLEVICLSAAFAIGAVCGAAIVLIICYGLCRLVLDRRRLAAWESAWALTGPRWTTRR